jgi:hypothetical protein
VDIAIICCACMGGVNAEGETGVKKEQHFERVILREHVGEDTNTGGRATF